MTRQELIDYCMNFPNVYEDYPFSDIKDIGIWTVMRHKSNKKTFAMIFERHGKLCVNLKCDPIEADFLRQAFTGVTAGYHMNKKHWNTVIIGAEGLYDSDVPVNELKRMIEHSYDLIKSKARKEK